MNTFCVQTLGCKVNGYESEQVASFLRARGWVQTSPAGAALRIINTCSVTVQAGSQSRQQVRRMVRLPVLTQGSSWSESRPRVLVIGCWATSDTEAASSLSGVDAVLTHRNQLAAELDRLLSLWFPRGELDTHQRRETRATTLGGTVCSPPRIEDNGWIKAGIAAGENTCNSKADSSRNVNVSLPQWPHVIDGSQRPGANSLPMLSEHQTGRQRAFLKVQDGCDAHCTYCIIPRLRPVLFSKPIGEAVEEAQRLVQAGHVEIVLSGIFLGAFGRETALRRRQALAAAPLARLVEALCTQVGGLKRLRLSSLEPGDLCDELLATLRSHEQVVPHFHLPVQSGSDAILRRMNRQYRRADFLQMLERVRAAFDRPALTTDVIVGFPGETDQEFDRTVEVVREARFIHVHAFGFSPRPGTAAARWIGQFVRGHIINERSRYLQKLAAEHDLDFRRQFVGQNVEVVVERGDAEPGLLHGRCERYFPVWFESAGESPGNLVSIRVDRVTPTRTFGTRLSVIDDLSPVANSPSRS